MIMTTNQRARVMTPLTRTLLTLKKRRMKTMEVAVRRWMMRRGSDARGGSLRKAIRWVCMRWLLFCTSDKPNFVLMSGRNQRSRKKRTRKSSLSRNRGLKRLQKVKRLWLKPQQVSVLSIRTEIFYAFNLHYRFFGISKRPNYFL